MTENNIRSMIYGMIVGEILGTINSNSNAFDYQISHYKLAFPFQYYSLSLHLKCMFQLGASVFSTKMYDKNYILNCYLLTVGELDAADLKHKNTVNIFDIYTDTKFSTTHVDALSKLGIQGRLNQTNEALLRCICLVPCGDEIVREDCNLTNPYEDCVSCNIFFLQILKKCLLRERFKLDEKMTDNLNIRKIISLAKNKIQLDLRYDIGSWSNTLYCALYSYFHIDSFEIGMNWVVRNSSKKDMRENASIVGCILGAKLGERLYKERETKKNFDETREILGQTRLRNDVDFYINMFEQSFTNVDNKK
jgi:hypothetical protein